MDRIDNECFTPLGMDFDGDSMISLKFLDSPSRLGITPIKSVQNEKSSNGIVIIDEDVHETHHQLLRSKAIIND